MQALFHVTSRHQLQQLVTVASDLTPSDIIQLSSFIPKHTADADATQLSSIVREYVFYVFLKRQFKKT